MAETLWSLLKPSQELKETISKRSSHTINFINDKIYIFGGEHVPRTPIDNDLFIIDLKINEWSELASENGPSPRLGHSSCSLNHNLFIFGGRTGVSMGETSLNDLYSFDTLTNTWTQLDTGNESKDVPEKRSYHTMTALDNKLYVFGGCSGNGGRLNDLFEYDLETKKWTRLPSSDLILPRGGSSLNAFKNENEKCLYLVGGFSGYELDDCYKYDIQTQKWSKIENLPRKLSVFACSATNNSNARLILHGGEVDPSTIGHNGAGEFSNDTYTYDGEKWNYLNMEVKPSSRGWHSSCYDYVNHKFYIYGGNLEDNFRTNELWSLNI